MLTLLWILCYVNSFEEKSYTPEITAPWDETHLPIILSRYRLEDIFNAGEFGLFFQALPSKTLKSKGEKWSGGKHSKVRLTGSLSLERAKIREASRTSSPCHVSIKHNQKAGWTQRSSQIG